MTTISGRRIPHRASRARDSRSPKMKKTNLFMSNTLPIDYLIEVLFFRCVGSPIYANVLSLPPKKSAVEPRSTRDGFIIILIE